MTKSKTKPASSSSKKAIKVNANAMAKAGAKTVAKSNAVTAAGKKKKPGGGGGSSSVSKKSSATKKNNTKKKPVEPKFVMCPYTNQKVLLQRATVKDVKNKSFLNDNNSNGKKKKRFILLPSPTLRSEIYAQAALALASAEQALLPSFGGRSWQVTCRLTDPGPSVLFRTWKGKLELAALPHLMEKIPNPPAWPGKGRGLEHFEEQYAGATPTFFMTSKTTTSAGGAALSDSVLKNNTNNANASQDLQDREISTLSSLAWDIRSDYPVPNVTIKWKSPDFGTFHSRKAAWEHAMMMSKREVQINKHLLGIGSSGKLLQPAFPSAPMTLKVGKLRFERDGLWVVGQELAWQEHRPKMIIQQEEEREQRRLQEQREAEEAAAAAAEEERRRQMEEEVEDDEKGEESEEQEEVAEEEEQQIKTCDMQTDNVCSNIETYPEEPIKTDDKATTTIAASPVEDATTTTITEEVDRSVLLQTRTSKTPLTYYIKCRRYAYRDECIIDRKQSVTLGHVDTELREIWKTLTKDEKDEWKIKLVQHEMSIEKEKSAAAAAAERDEEAAKRAAEEALTKTREEEKGEDNAANTDTTTKVENAESSHPLCTEGEESSFNGASTSSSSFQEEKKEDEYLAAKRKKQEEEIDDVEKTKISSLSTTTTTQSNATTTIDDVTMMEGHNDNINNNDDDMNKKIPSSSSDLSTKVMEMKNYHKDYSQDIGHFQPLPTTSKTTDKKNNENNIHNDNATIDINDNATTTKTRTKTTEATTIVASVASTNVEGIVTKTQEQVEQQIEHITDGEIISSKQQSSSSSMPEEAVAPSPPSHSKPTKPAIQYNSNKRCIPTQKEVQRFCLNKEQINLCYDACIEHYDQVMRTVKVRDLSRELQDGFDVLRERGRGRYDMELPVFDNANVFGFLTDIRTAPWMPIVRTILGDDVMLIHKGCFLSMPGADAQEYHQDGIHLNKYVQKPCHAINVFIPLIDLSARAGPTEFCLGSHVLGQEGYDRDFIETPKPKAGTPIIFDYRLGHRGLGNSSMSCRPIVYCTYARAILPTSTTTTSTTTGTTTNTAAQSEISTANTTNINSSTCMTDSNDNTNTTNTSNTSTNTSNTTNTNFSYFQDFINFSKKRYHKIGTLIDKPISREERCKKRQKLISQRIEERELQRVIELSRKERERKDK